MPLFRGLRVQDFASGCCPSGARGTCSARPTEPQRSTGSKLRFAVSPALRDAYANGRTYYELAGRTIATPAVVDSQPSRDLLEWHGNVVFRA